jgi:hypothetical protein
MEGIQFVANAKAEKVAVVIEMFKNSKKSSVAHLVFSLTPLLNRSTLVLTIARAHVRP